MSKKSYLVFFVDFSEFIRNFNEKCDTFNDSIYVYSVVVFAFLYGQFGTIFLQTFEALTTRVNSLRAGYLSVRTAEGASEKQSSLKARLRNGLTYLLTYLLRSYFN